MRDSASDVPRSRQDYRRGIINHTHQRLLVMSQVIDENDTSLYQFFHASHIHCIEQYKTKLEETSSDEKDEISCKGAERVGVL